MSILQGQSFGNLQANSLLQDILNRQTSTFQGALDNAVQLTRDSLNLQAGQESNLLEERRFDRKFREDNFRDRRDFDRNVFTEDRAFDENVRQFNIQDENADQSRALQRSLGFSRIATTRRGQDLAERQRKFERDRLTTQDELAAAARQERRDLTNQLIETEQSGVLSPTFKRQRSEALLAQARGLGYENVVEAGTNLRKDTAAFRLEQVQSQNLAKAKEFQKKAESAQMLGDLGRANTYQAAAGALATQSGGLGSESFSIPALAKQTIAENTTTRAAIDTDNLNNPDGTLSRKPVSGSGGRSNVLTPSQIDTKVSDVSTGVSSVFDGIEAFPNIKKSSELFASITKAVAEGKTAEAYAREGLPEEGKGKGKASRETIEKILKQRIKVFQSGKRLVETGNMPAEFNVDNRESRIKALKIAR